jgi:hypothetical protein
MPPMVITYIENDNMCAYYYKVDRKDEMNGWTVVNIIGSDRWALFQNELDATVWLKSQSYVRPAGK